MKRRTDLLILAAALVALVVIGVLTTAGPAPPPYLSSSAAPDGTLALYRWLGLLGYRPVRLASGPLHPRNLRALVVLEPRAPFSSAEVASTLEWVRGGGALLLLEDGGDATLPHALHVSFRHLSPSQASAARYGATPVQPLLARPPLGALAVPVTTTVDGTAPGVIPVLAFGGVRAPGAKHDARIAPPDPREPVLVYEALGRGRVYVGSIPGALANGAIARGDNRRLALNTLAGLPAGAAVGFDDYHLAPPTAAAPASLTAALTATAWGRALVYALLLVAAYIALTGRRLGRPLRAVPERGRSLAEYVVSMAAIFRRAGVRARVLALWQDGLRRELAGPSRARGRPDADLMAEAARRAGLTEGEQRDALALLTPRASLSESALVDLCRRIDHLQRRLASRGDEWRYTARREEAEWR